VPRAAKWLPEAGPSPRPLRFLLGSFGDPGHTFPVIALGRELVRRGHEVTIETWERWQAAAEAEGMAFAASPEYHVFPTRERPLKPYEAVARAALVSQAVVQEMRPDAVVADILTLAPALGGELEGVPVATLVPHLHPATLPGWAPYSMGARLPRTPLGRALWRSFDPVVRRGLEIGRRDLNETRRRLGLPALDRVHGGLSQQLCMIATFPQLEYPRAWQPWEHVVGPLFWEQPFGEVELPPGDAPLVLVAPSTSQDPEQRLLRAAVEGLAGEAVRVLATTNRRPPPEPIPVPSNTRLVEWLSYERTMPRCDVVVCHGGHGTVARALASGAIVVVVPAAGDMNENGARVDWAGVGVRLPRRLATPGAVRLAVRAALSDQRLRARARELAAWSAGHDGAARAAGLVERLAQRTRASRAATLAVPMLPAASRTTA
jgi:UDP:flavonoid glycosyltransferase YjiC (YdhE family)